LFQQPLVRIRKSVHHLRNDEKRQVWPDLRHEIERNGAPRVVIIIEYDEKRIGKVEQEHSQRNDNAPVHFAFFGRKQKQKIGREQYNIRNRIHPSQVYHVIEQYPEKQDKYEKIEKVFMYNSLYHFYTDLFHKAQKYNDFSTTNEK
jgi:hypothetical protein